MAVRFPIRCSVLPIALLACANLHAQRIEVRPETILSGDEVQIVLKQFPRDARIEVRAERALSPWQPGAKAALYRSQAQFQTSAAGSLDLSTATPVEGSYAVADVRGLAWSMQPTGEQAPGDWPTNRLHFKALVEGEVVAEASLTIHSARDDVVVEEIGDAFPGAVFAHLPGKARRPAIIVLGGSEGYDWVARGMSPQLASHGFAVLGLPYHAPAFIQRRDLDMLPKSFTDIPVDRLQSAYEWLRRRDDVDADRIGLYGVSKGAEFSLIAATRMDWIDAVAAIVPSDVVWEGFGAMGVAPGTRSSFSWHGEPLPFVPYDNIQAEFSAMGSGSGAVLRRPHDHGRAANTQRAIAARIPVETYRGALLVAGGMLDAVWASGPMAQSIAERRAEAGLETTTLVFWGAGHALTGDGWSPTTQLDAGPMSMGGLPADTAQAQAATWRATLEFFKAHLAPAAPQPVVAKP